MRQGSLEGFGSLLRKLARRFCHPPRGTSKGYCPPPNRKVRLFCHPLSSRYNREKTATHPAQQVVKKLCSPVLWSRQGTAHLLLFMFITSCSARMSRLLVITRNQLTQGNHSARRESNAPALHIHHEFVHDLVEVRLHFGPLARHLQEPPRITARA
jgi:hypothetical protein